MGSGIGEELYTIAHKKNHKRFIDVLVDISQNTTVDARQLDILIKIDFSQYTEINENYCGYLIYTTTPSRRVRQVK